MDIGRRNTQKYGFRAPDLTELRKLVSLVDDRSGFLSRYGRLLFVLSTNIEDGILNTLMQFYDPIYRCFTFPDYQLMPTLEEYAYLLGVPVSDKVPYTGLEEALKPQDIAEATHLTKSDIDANLKTKGGLKGLTAKFLIEKATLFADIGRTLAFEAILALLIYGLVLFPNIDNFVDINAIRIFSIGNPVPTLLGDTYFSIHSRTSKGNGTIVCCIPLLYNWFVSHLPQTSAFRKNKDCLRWSQRIMSLTHTNITWSSSVYDNVQIIDSCGEFANVPLLGIQGGINYNLSLARRQLGYMLKDRPKNILLEGLFFQGGDDSLGLRRKMAHAWTKIHRLGRGELGRQVCIALEPYTLWVKKRAMELKMPYPIEKPLTTVISTPLPTPLPVSSDDVKTLQDTLAKMKEEKEMWESKFQASDKEKMELQKQMKEKDDLIELLERRAVKRHAEDLFSSTTPSAHPPISGAWKGIVDQLVLEKITMKHNYEKEIKRLRRKYQLGSSSDGP